MAGDANLFDELLSAMAKERRGLPVDDADESDLDTWRQEDRDALAELAEDLGSFAAHKNVLARTVETENEGRVQVVGRSGRARSFVTLPRSMPSPVIRIADLLRMQ